MEKEREGKCYPVSYVIARCNPFSQCTGWEDLLVALPLRLEVRHCWYFKSLLLEDYWHGTMWQLLETYQRGGLSLRRIYLKGKVMCQVRHKWVMLWTELVVGGSHEPTCYWTLLATLKVDPSKATGSAQVEYYAW